MSAFLPAPLSSLSCAGGHCFQANRWEAAHKLAPSYMSEGEVRVLYMEQAQKMEDGGNLLEAEKLYLQVGEVLSTLLIHRSYYLVNDVGAVRQLTRAMLKSDESKAEKVNNDCKDTCWTHVPCCLATKHKLV